MNSVTPTRKTLRVAIVGSGPSGFYAAEALLRSEYAIAVDVYEKLPVPYGLVRFGVAPDHPKLKLVVNIFDKIAQMEGFRFIGNVCIGKDISLQTLSDHYHAVILACGAECEKDLDIPGESLPGSHSALEFVAWYNGHPHYRDREFDFSHERAVVIGQGNVALDVARILSKTVDELQHTDIADYALEALAESNIKHIHVIGRRGPVQAKFSEKELREFATLANCTPKVSSADMQLNEASCEELQDVSHLNVANNIERLTDFTTLSVPASYSRVCHFQFFQSPAVIGGTDRVSDIVLDRNRLDGPAFSQRAMATGESVTLDCGLVFRCIGYRAVPIPGLEYDDSSGVLSHREGRLLADGNILPGLYAAGWIKRGPSGTIGTNRGDSRDTVDALLEDFHEFLKKPTSDADKLLADLKKGGKEIVHFPDWKKIDAREIARAQSTGKPRRKLTSVPEMLMAL
ncbi:NADP oxidoreductase [Halieaceae bacterium IMCC8485]|uniref:NADP oxidoreductase n=1 Tax=Candidatus Seongchinamella marina TaxID=2518990 RepID=A0ABT3SZK0_9GAMM|nr:FAD-dependent oxidoreductase [Candidatus Seongchinamella marina]MCX2975432.1 NADP oxidoreductase [Candidatus Seongchinamella marina]